MIVSGTSPPEQVQHGARCAQGQLSTRLIEPDGSTDREIDKQKELDVYETMSRHHVSLNKTHSASCLTVL